ncbi:hypothetical protein ACFL3D_02465 [Candidatus Omnitrophota bacterium]
MKSLQGITKNIKRAVFILIFACICSGSFAYEAEFEYEHLVLWHAQTQMKAAINDMLLPVAWYPDDTDMLREVSEQLVEDLDEISVFILDNMSHKDLEPYKDDILEMINLLARSFKDYDLKEEDDFCEEFDEFYEFRNKVGEDFNKFLLDRREREMFEMPEQIEYWTEYESNLAETPEDAIRYREAIQLMSDHYFDEAFPIIEEMFKRYDESEPFHDALSVALSDCLERITSDVRITGEWEDSEFSLFLLEEIINKKEYTPLLCKAFYRWRTLEQYLNHGTSNMSKIPNKEYNEKRWEIIKVIHEHLIEHPDDAWAWGQRNWLMELPIIERGGPCGNSNLIHWALLYTDVYQEMIENTQDEESVPEEVVVDEAEEE